ncbi:MAG: ABC transporter permease, partial [Acidimicrobiales bacterium]
EREFVEAGRAAGASNTRLMVRHIAPNLIGPVVVFSTIDMGQTLLMVSSLSFLGFGVPPPAPEWGSMLSESRHLIDRAPQLLAYPGVAITLVVLSFNLAGDGLRDLLDPRSQATHRRWRDRPQRRRREERAAELVEAEPLPVRGAANPAPS